ncbi:MAG: thiamine pyrophosphate-dependent dehydrogenase E1 component subunit alpha [Planctomycetota bacterium]
MPIHDVFNGSVSRVEILSADGSIDEQLADEVRDVLDDEAVVAAYREMLVARELDDAAYRLQRSGRMGTFPQNKGQEAGPLAAAMTLIAGHDHVVPSYRENIALFYLGLPMHQILLHWMGDERGNDIDAKLGISPICISIGAHLPHAAGIGWKLKIDNDKHGTDRVCMAFFGDGATSEGAFHDGLNFAATGDAPVVFVCQNNGWAISVPTEKQTRSKTFAQKALAYGMPGFQADGNDLFASFKVCRDAVRHARAGNGPALVELTTYRIADHTTVDDASRYRSKEEHERGVASDPLIRTRRYLETRGQWNDDLEKQEKERATRIVKEVIATAMEIEKPVKSDIFDYAFATTPRELERQRETRRTGSLGQSPRQSTLSRVEADEAVAV